MPKRFPNRSKSSPGTSGGHGFEIFGAFGGRLIFEEFLVGQKVTHKSTFGATEGGGPTIGELRGLQASAPAPGPGARLDIYTTTPTEKIRICWVDICDCSKIYIDSLGISID